MTILTPIHESHCRQGGSGTLETTRGRFFSLRLKVPPLLNKVSFRPKMVCFSAFQTVDEFQESLKSILAGDVM